MGGYFKGYFSLAVFVVIFGFVHLRYSYPFQFVVVLVLDQRLDYVAFFVSVNLFGVYGHWYAE